MRTTRRGSAGAPPCSSLDGVDYTDKGQAAIFYFLTAYVVHGRTPMSLDVNQNGTPIDPVRINELVTTAAQRLAAHAPAD